MIRHDHDGAAFLLECIASWTVMISTLLTITFYIVHIRGYFGVGAMRLILG
jgi:hypothetical protein